MYKTAARALLKQGYVDILKWYLSKGGEIGSLSWVLDWRLPISLAWSEDTGEQMFRAFYKAGILEN